MFSYQALGEMTEIGKSLAQAFYDLSNDTKIYTYFEGCSDGGREGMSQVQRWGELYDGVVAGAPAFRFAQQQVLHVYPAEVEHTMDYYPPPCALEKIVNATISACDSLDGRTDGVISRTDLCKLQFDLDTVVGEPYYCAAQTSSSPGFGFDKRQAPGSQTSSTPEQNGTVTSQDVAVAKAIYAGLHNSQGQQAYLSWQIGSSLSDGNPNYNNETDAWELNIPSTGGAYVTKFVQLLDLDNLSDLDGVTYDTLVEWMQIGMVRYLDSLQTTLPDLTPFQSSGGKLLHYHGESDSSIPAGSSVHYWQSARSIMYANLSDSELKTLCRIGISSISSLELAIAVQIPSNPVHTPRTTCKQSSTGLRTVSSQTVSTLPCPPATTLARHNCFASGLLARSGAGIVRTSTASTTKPLSIVGPTNSTHLNCPCTRLCCNRSRLKRATGWGNG